MRRHDRASAYVLLKVEKQIETLIDQDCDTISASTVNEAMQDNRVPSQVNPGIPCQSVNEFSDQQNKALLSPNEQYSKSNDNGEYKLYNITEVVNQNRLNLI